MTYSNYFIREITENDGKHGMHGMHDMQIV